MLATRSDCGASTAGSKKPLCCVAPPRAGAPADHAATGGATIVAAALVIFVLAVSEFGVPGLLRVRVYTTEVFTAFAALYDFSRASCWPFRCWRCALSSVRSPRGCWETDRVARVGSPGAIRRCSTSGGVAGRIVVAVVIVAGVVLPIARACS